MINRSKGCEWCTVRGQSGDADELSTQGFGRNFGGIDQATSTDSYHGISMTDFLCKFVAIFITGGAVVMVDWQAQFAGINLGESSKTFFAGNHNWLIKIR